MAKIKLRRIPRFYQSNQNMPQPKTFLPVRFVLLPFYIYWLQFWCMNLSLLLRCWWNVSVFCLVLYFYISMFWLPCLQILQVPKVVLNEVENVNTWFSCTPFLLKAMPTISILAVSYGQAPVSYSVIVLRCWMCASGRYCYLGTQGK